MIEMHLFDKWDNRNGINIYKKKIEDKANLSDKNVRLIVEKVKNLNKVA